MLSSILVQCFMPYLKIRQICDSVDLAFSIESHSQKSLSFDSVIRWDEFGADDRKIQVFECTLGSDLIRRKYFPITTEAKKSTQVFITEINGFAASKSNLSEFFSMEDFVLKQCADFVNKGNAEQLRENLKHDQIRIFREDILRNDPVCRFSWDERVFLMNSGGSHHLAAAILLSNKLDIPVDFITNTTEYTLDPMKIDQLNRDFAMYVIGDSNLQNALFAMMRQLDIPFIRTLLPKRFEGITVYLFPRGYKKSARIIKIMQQAGVFDLGAYFEKKYPQHNIL
jgi:hypothetical protein